MVYSSKQRRSLATPSRLAISVGLSALSLQARAFVVSSASSSTSGEAAVLGQSSVRKSINFGPHVQSVHHTIASPDDTISLWNASPLRNLYSVTGATAQVLGQTLSKAFVESLHPSSQFRFVSGYTSKHSNVFHAHFVETINNIDIANANLNVNIDLDTNEIVSYGDSSFAKSQAPKRSTLSAWKDKVASWAIKAEDQVVEAIGQPAQTIFNGNGPQTGADDAEESYSSPPFNPAPQATTPAPKATDPRHGLLTFLAVQSPTQELSQVLMSSPRTTLVDMMYVAKVEGTVHSRKIHGVPTALEPVKATLTYVHDDKNVRLAWKYEIKTDDNAYEAYIQADADVSGDEETLLVVDWVRDFRPTGGELGMEAVSTVGGLQRGAAARGSNGVAGASFRRASRNVANPLGGLRRSNAFVREAIEEPAKDAEPTYKVFPWGVNDPSVGKREVLSGKSLSRDDEASPAGWHTVPSDYKGGNDKKYTDTRGNNVFAQDNVDGGSSSNGYRPSGGKDLTFDFKLGWPKAGTPLEPHTYINASVTQLFYTNNLIHDMFHRYGFDEESGNFQEYNFGRGGLGNDAVQANAQDGSGMNNANFMTPPDGQKPRMRMYSWSGTQPYRDGDFEAGIVIHEYSHGISTRLTGSPDDSTCLGWGEAGGMGEGWGDFFASAIRMQAKNETDVTMGEWASSRAGGIRNYPYSLNTTTNLDTYKSLDKPGYWGVHAIGEVWAEMLWEMMHNLIKKHGYESSLFPPAVGDADDNGFYNKSFKGKKVPAKGNTLAVQLVVDGLKLQPCRPSFQNARDAILAADKTLTGGDNACEIWKAFSKRGLGPDAVLRGSLPWGGGGIRTEDYKVPKTCK